MPRSVHAPSPFHRKILASEAPGGAPADLRIVIPSILRPGTPFPVRLALLDALGYPSLQASGTARVELPGGETVEVPFHSGQPACAMIDKVFPEKEGLMRIHATCGNLEAVSNPAFCTRDNLPGIYWGDPHVHTNLSHCHVDTCRSLNFCYTAARHLSLLDWVSAADHVSNGRGDASKWKEQRTVSTLYDDPPRFATLPAYEASLPGGAGGDNNVYMNRFPEMFVDEYESGTVKTLCRRLEEVLPDRSFFVIPHHTTRTGKHGEISDAIYPGPRAMPLIEIHSKWGTSEFRGNPNPLKKIHPGPSYARDLLQRGLQLGFVAGTDSHATMPSAGGVEPSHIDRLPGLTAVMTHELSRANLFDALRRRHCYAASLERILLLGSVAGTRFGGECSAGKLSAPARFDITAAAKSDITRIDLVRDGEILHSVAPGDWHAHVTFDDPAVSDLPLTDPRNGSRFRYYYVRVTCASGAQAWSSPVWITA